MRRRSFLYDDHGRPRLLVPGLAAALAAFLVALALVTFVSRPRTDEERALAFVRSGRPARAEELYARLLRERPSVELALGLLDAHDAALQQEVLSKLREQSPRAASGMPSDPPMSEDAVDALLADLPEEISLVARFSRGVGRGGVPSDVRAEIVVGAAREPPLPWANHLLAREAVRELRPRDAAPLYEREGLSFPERRTDVDRSLEIWLTLNDWDTLRDRLADPRVAAAAGASVKYRLAVHDDDWRSAIRHLPKATAPRLGGPGLVISAIAALGWAFFCARLGKLRERPAFRLPLYAAAFVLGVASILPTVLLIAIEESKLHLVQTGDPARDVLFFVFGVGLREEAAKLLLFLPLLPILRRWGNKLDVLVCGAMVGLGFAAEENLSYLADDSLTTGLARFVTANFFHMALTGTLASALDDFVGDRERYAADFSRTSLFVVAIHGGYDFLISHPQLGGPYLAMAAFVFLTRLFLDAVDRARRRADRGLTPLHAFVIAMATVTGVSFAYAVIAVGPADAVLVLGNGLLGVAIIVYVFVRTLRAM